VTASMQLYVKEVIIPKTELICLAGFTNADIAKICYRFAHDLSQSVQYATLSSFLPMCQDVCWSSCAGTTIQDRDGYDNCRDSSCANANCGKFLLDECPESSLPMIRRLIDSTCGLGSPSPPPAPSPTPGAPPPPRAPPPLAAEFGELRLKSSDTPSSPDCKPVTYNSCLKAAIEVAPHLKSSPGIELILSGCESNEATGSCFIGCSLGGPGPAKYTYLDKEKLVAFGNYNSYRCSAAADPYCLCGSEASPPPAPILADASSYRYSGIDVASTFESSPSAWFKQVGRDIAMPSDFRKFTTEYDCIAEDDGADHCAKHCSENLKGDLTSFSVSGLIAPPPPPLPGGPPAPPIPPPSPLPPMGAQFNGASDACSLASVYQGDQCRDGGVGSIFPP
jgi:hypothetical protein